MKNSFRKISVLVFSLQCLCADIFSQVVISGPTCVVPGTVYQYIINGKWDASVSVSVSITGGTLIDSPKKPSYSAVLPAISRLRVTWNESNEHAGSLMISSAKGNSSLAVHFTKKLTPGSIEGICKKQVIDTNTIPLKITCSIDTGGSCSPVYSYQWQWSLNAVTWQDIPLATNQNLSIDSTLKQSKFYRRKVTETGSGSIAYSDVASVLIIMAPTDTVSHVDSTPRDQYKLQRQSYTMTNNYSPIIAATNDQQANAWIKKENEQDEFSQ